MSEQARENGIASVLSRVTMPRAETHEGWWAQRAPFVGSSTAAALFGEHPFTTPAQMARERRNGNRTPDNPAMARGRFLEDAIGQWWAAEHNAEVAEAPLLYVVNGVLIATLDRLIVGEDAALEIKTTTRHVHEPERYWWWQCQGQLACTGFERIELAAFDGSMTLQSFTVYPDDDAIARLVVAAADFLAAVERGDEFDDPKPTGESIELDARTRHLAHSLHVAEVRADEINKDIGILKGRLDHALGAHDVGTINGKPAVRRMYRTMRNAIDGARLRAEQPDIAREYTKEPRTSHHIKVTL